MKNLNDFGVVELKKEELREVEGGILPIVAYSLITLYLASTVAAVSQGKNPHTGASL